MKRVLSALLALCLCLSSTACGDATADKQEKYDTYSYDYFDTVSIISGYESDRAEFDRVTGEALSLLREYHQLYNVYLRYDGLNNLCTINDLVDGAHATVTVDQKIIDLLVYAKEMYQQTNGLVNVAMGSVLKLWHDHRAVGMDDPASATLPAADALAEAAKHTSIDHLVIDEVNRTVTLTDPQMRLDVGAIAKGYAVEQVALWLEEQGKTGYVLNVGGNVRTIGGKPDGTGWTVGIEDPQDTTADYVALLELSGQSLVTSGSYQRYYYVGGKRYHHIIHPDTLMPAEGLLSVSVVCNDSGQGDALSTALFCMSVEEGKTLVESLPEVEAQWIAEDGSKTTSSGWNHYVKE